MKYFKSEKIAVAFCLVIIWTLSPYPVRADIKLPALFASDMVIQRETQTPVWGWAEPGEQVSVNASWGTLATATGGQLSPCPATGKPFINVTEKVSGINRFDHGNRG